MRRLTMLTLAAPAAAQLAMIAMMAAEGRWPFVALVIPGLVGCVASLMLAVARRRQDPDAAGGGAGPPSPAADAAEPAGTADFGAMESRPLAELLGLHGEPLPWRGIVARWLDEPDHCVPLGCGADGVHRVDLVRQGPHALVAGTTGSGKSMLLQTWCLALAACNSPRTLRFVFLDFKGGAAFAALERLPHAVGAVSDLDLAHAMRALRALEAELTRRERLVARERAGSFDRLADPPPRIVVVVDEFHALRGQLPDGVGRIARLASLGRSLGMHVIACTQHPLGQVGADMKANMNLNICLRVRDAMQSTELIGSARAASIGPSTPGAAYLSDGADVAALRCASPGDVDALVSAMSYAAAFHRIARPEPLFTPPLPGSVGAGPVEALAPAACGPAGDRAGTPPEVPFGLADDGMRFSAALLPIGRGNAAVAGPPGRGKSTLLATLARQARRRFGSAVRVRVTTRSHGDYRTDELGPAHTDRRPPCAPPAPTHRLWLCDDADDLLDPLETGPEAVRLRQALADPSATVVVAVADSRRVRDPARFPCRIVFPTGDRPTDMMDGVPADALALFEARDYARPGRAVLLRDGRAAPVQCLAPDEAGGAGPGRLDRGEFPASSVSCSETS